MTAPVLPPALTPFAEAVEFHRGRTPRLADDFGAVDVAVRMRSFTIAGLTKLAAVTSAYHLALDSLVTGEPEGTFEKKLQALVSENGGSLLPRSRVDLIFRNNNAICTSAGRWRQITEGGIADARPYGRYPLGPDDSSTTSVCRRLQGLVFPLRSKLARRIWPPNHHGERHINVVTLTEQQARASGRMYEGDPNDEYPFVENPQTGEAGRVLPDPGFDFDPDLLAADGAHLRRKAAQLGAPLPAKSASDFRLAPLTDAVARELPPLPLALDATSDDEAANEFAEAFGIAADLRSAMLADFAGDGVIVTRESRDAISRAVPSILYAALRSAIEDPFEVWMMPFGESLRPQLVRRYIALFDDEGELVAVTVDRSPDGWLMNAAAYRGEIPEPIRRGFPTTTKSSPLAR